MITVMSEDRVTTNLENLEYSGISTNMENPENSQRILCNFGKFLTNKIVSVRSNICITLQALALQMNKIL